MFPSRGVDDGIAVYLTKNVSLLSVGIFRRTPKERFSLRIHSKADTHPSVSHKMPSEDTKVCKSPSTRVPIDTEPGFLLKERIAKVVEVGRVRVLQS